MPCPWETNKQVQVVYHKQGVLSIANDIPKTNEMIYKTLWAVVWGLMKKNKENNEGFYRTQIPPFDDEEPPMSYMNNI